MNTTTEPIKKRGMRSTLSSFLINRNFGLLLSGQAISYIGDFVFDTTLVLWIATLIARNQSWAPLAVSGVLLATGVPTFLIGPLAGVFVDRWNKRHTMLWMDAIRAALILLLLPISVLSLPVSWQLFAIYAVVFLASTCTQFFGPSRFALIGDVVDEPHRAQASSMNFTTLSIAIIIGPALAAPLFFSIGLQWALVLNALSFVVSFFAIFAVRRSQDIAGAGEAVQANFLREFAEGIRFYLNNRVLVTLLVSSLLAVFGAEAINTLNIFFITQNLHAAPSLFGLLGTASGIGLIVGSALGGIFIARLGVARTFWLSLTVVGLLLFVYARQTSFIPAFVLLCLVGLPSAALNVAIMPLVLYVTPKELIGRAISVFAPVSSLASILSVSLAGYLDSVVLRGFHTRLSGITFGPVDSIFMATGIIITLGGLYAMLNLRGVTLAKKGDS